MPNMPDAEMILERLAEIRSMLPAAPAVSSPVRASEALARLRALRLVDMSALSEFELETVLDASESLIEELRAAIDEARLRAFENALDVYYTAEELVRSGEHPELVPHLEAMRAAYERSYGEPVPSRAETVARRAQQNAPR